MGSSTVMMWALRDRFARSTSDASVVDLPEPVGPVTSTSPRGKRAKLRHDLRDAKRLERLDLVRNDAEGGAHGVALPVHVDAEARLAHQRVREVEFEVLFKLFALLLRQHRVQRALQAVRLQHVESGQRRQLTIEPHHRRRARGQVKVRGPERAASCAARRQRRGLPAASLAHMPTRAGCGAALMPAHACRAG